jgi:tetratricopeptide (TPR) repeat protein
MVWSVSDAAFRDLRRLADWLSTGPARFTPLIERLLKRLGVTAVPLLGRELCSADPARRDIARDALEAIAGLGDAARSRVATALQAITSGAVPDEAKVVALGLLSELGEHADALFADPDRIRERSAIALAAQLETAADVAGAADLMVHDLDAADLSQMLEVMAASAPGAAHRLASELALRLDLPGAARDRLSALLATLPASAATAPPDPPAELRDRPIEAAVLVDAAARLVVIASRRIAGSRGWRRWAVLIGASGRIDDCLHEDDAGPDGGSAPLITTLCADGYRVASSDRDHAREVVAAAARHTAESTRALPSPYYLGRDLLELGAAHAGTRGTADPASAALARAIELVAQGDHARALPLLERCDPDHPDAAAAHAACLIALHRPGDALAALDRALAVEPDWALHHWNRAAALHQLGDARGCYDALRRFVATSAIPSGLFGDPEQPARVGRAERILAELERSSRLAGHPLGRRARSRPSRAKRTTAEPRLRRP